MPAAAAAATASAADGGGDMMMRMMMMITKKGEDENSSNSSVQLYCLANERSIFVDIICHVNYCIRCSLSPESRHNY